MKVGDITVEQMLIWVCLAIISNAAGRALGYWLAIHF